MRRLHAISGVVILCAWCVTIGKWLWSADSSGMQLTTPAAIIFFGYLYGENWFRGRKHDD